MMAADNLQAVQDLTHSAAPFRSALREWFQRQQRDLPWRRRRSLYGTVVSEFMLQQTQVVTVLPYYERWMRDLPDFTALARADESRVLHLWEGLGYYSRARNLHRLARRIEDQGVPQTGAEWLEMPGVGPYAAAAIGSIAQSLPLAVVDGNVVRILSRLTEDGRSFASGSVAMKAFAPIADTLLDRDHPGLHNEAMMELGALICTKAHPRCLLCPVRPYCAAGRKGTADLFPRIERAKTSNVAIDRAWCVRGAAILLSRVPSTSRRLADCYELPLLSVVTAQDKPTGANPPKLLLKKPRAISSQRISESIYEVSDAAVAPSESTILDAEGCAPSDAHTLHWIALKDLPGIRLSGPHRRWVNELLSKHN